MLHERGEKRSQTPSDILSCPHKSPECAKYPGPVRYSPTSSMNPVPSLCTLLMWRNLLWLSWRKLKSRQTDDPLAVDRLQWVTQKSEGSLNPRCACGLRHSPQRLCCATGSPCSAALLLPSPACPRRGTASREPSRSSSSCFCSLLIATGQRHYRLQRASCEMTRGSRGKWPPGTCPNISAWWSAP